MTCEVCQDICEVCADTIRDLDASLESCGAAEEKWRRRALAAEARAEEAESDLEMYMLGVVEMREPARG